MRTCFVNVFEKAREKHPHSNVVLHLNNASTHPTKVRDKLRGIRFINAKVALNASQEGVDDAPKEDWANCFLQWFQRMKTLVYILSNNSDSVDVVNLDSDSTVCSNPGIDFGFDSSSTYDSDFDLAIDRELAPALAAIVNFSANNMKATNTNLPLDRYQRLASRIVDNPLLSCLLNPLALSRDVAYLFTFHRVHYGECSEHLFNLIRHCPSRRQPSRSDLPSVVFPTNTFDKGVFKKRTYYNLKDRLRTRDSSGVKGGHGRQWPSTFRGWARGRSRLRAGGGEGSPALAPNPITPPAHPRQLYSGPPCLLRGGDRPNLSIDSRET
ncbi:hypothetical protein EVAR_38792_1 [Eumeta japonica]|uniref:Uncharacterized protein n=1 Tax=Eumeta variegata TaxID=151549 RepID=A0A4C1WJ05_EUMVA|nr:hypothetical protein EVAR_38792_1 [Eumeta japonica]